MYKSIYKEYIIKINELSMVLYNTLLVVANFPEKCKSNSLPSSS